MDQGATEAVKIIQPRELSRIMALIASGIVAFEGLILMAKILPASFEGLGSLSIGTVSLILFQIILLACIVGIFSLIILLDKEGRFRNRLKFASIASFVIGLILSIEGLLAVNLNGYIVTGTSSVLMICVGLELFTLGILSMLAHVQNGKLSSRNRSVLLIAAILFMLLMLPPAFLAV